MKSRAKTDAKIKMQEQRDIDELPHLLIVYLGNYTLLCQPPADLRAGRVGPARGDAAAAVGQPPEPFGSPDADEVERARHGALSPRCGGRDGPGPLCAR